MRTVLVRHGKAEGGSPDGTDYSRDLRPQGERQAAHVGSRLIDAAPPVVLIVSSRAVRAWRTAEIIGGLTGVAVEGDGALLVDEPAGVVIDKIASWGERVGREGTLVLVGHNPQVEMLVAVLGGGSEFVGGGIPRGMRTGEAAVLEIDPEEPIGGVLLDRWRLEEA